MVSQKKVFLRSQNETKDMTNILIKGQSPNTAFKERYRYASGVITTIHKSHTVRAIIISIQCVIKKVARAVLCLLRKKKVKCTI